MDRRSVNRLLAGMFGVALAAPFAASFTLTAAPSMALAFDEASAAAVNVDEKKLILRGYDAVAYFTQGKPIKGSPEFTATHDGASYYFASAENRDAFAADPAKYVPQFGGFCAMGVALGKKLDGDPELFRVVDDKLYLNVNEAAQSRWLQDIPGNITQANTTWPSIREKAPKEIN